MNGREARLFTAISPVIRKPVLKLREGLLAAPWPFLDCASFSRGCWKTGPISRIRRNAAIRR